MSCAVKAFCFTLKPLHFKQSSGKTYISEYYIFASPVLQSESPIAVNRFVYGSFQFLYKKRKKTKFASSKKKCDICSLKVKEPITIERYIN